MTHECKHDELTESQFNEYRHHLIEKVSSILDTLQAEFKETNKCEDDFDALILNFALDHVITTMKHVCRDAGENHREILMYVIERISESLSVKFVNTEVSHAMEQMRSATIQ